MHNFFLSLSCTPKKAFDILSGNLLGPALRSVQIREAALDQPVTFISCSTNDIKSSAIYFINKKTKGTVRRN